MTTVIPQSELTRKAVAWISEKSAEDDARNLNALIEEAAARFNLSPKDVLFLQRFFEENKG